jgi:hypothetical protein
VEPAGNLGRERDRERDPPRGFLAEAFLPDRLAARFFVEPFLADRPAARFFVEPFLAGLASAEGTSGTSAACFFEELRVLAGMAFTEGR